MTFWKDHFILRGDGHNGFHSVPAKLRILPKYDGRTVWPFGLATMDRGEIALLGTPHPPDPSAGDFPIIAFSNDNGETWSDYRRVPDAAGRPMMTAWLGGGTLTFIADTATAKEYPHRRFFSHDRGRTWQAMPLQPAPNGGPFHVEGNPLIDRDADGNVTTMAEIGWNYHGDWAHSFPNPASNCFLRWSRDGGRSWPDSISPDAWIWEDSHLGVTGQRSAGEGSVIRAANGDLVAALRTDRRAEHEQMEATNDHVTGTAVSISTDNGATWSPLDHLFHAGRHHAHLLRRDNGDLVMTLICRLDMKDGDLASYREGCEAMISHDHGRTWRRDDHYILDHFVYHNPDRWVDSQCGHLYSTPLADGTILTGYANYLVGGILIQWTPEDNG